MTSYAPHPVVLVDAGDEPWSRIEPVIEQRYAELATGSELGVVARDPGVAAALVAWCAVRSIRLGSVPGAAPDSGRVFVLHAAVANPLEEL